MKMAVMCRNISAAWVPYKEISCTRTDVTLCIHNCIHYIDVVMTTVASQITSLTVVYWIVYSGAYQRKHQSSASLAFVWGFQRDLWVPRTKGKLRGKCFHLMTSSCISRNCNKQKFNVVWDCWRVAGTKSYFIMQTVIQLLLLSLLSLSM